VFRLDEPGQIGGWSHRYLRSKQRRALTTRSSIKSRSRLRDCPAAVARVHLMIEHIDVRAYSATPRTFVGDHAGNAARATSSRPLSDGTVTFACGGERTDLACASARRHLHVKKVGITVSDIQHKIDDRPFSLNLILQLPRHSVAAVHWMAQPLDARAHSATPGIPSPMITPAARQGRRRVARSLANGRRLRSR